MTVTLADVAARARVSPATVSRVLNGNYPVAASTRERVLRAVDDLDYVLNGPASSLAAATSDLIGILVNDIADPFFGIMAGAAQSEIGGPGDGSGRAGGEKLAIVCNTGGTPERELTYLTLLQRQRAAAVVLTGGAVEDPAHQVAMSAKLAKLADAGTRVVLCGRPPLPDGASVLAALAFDNRGGGRRLTEHLISLGHRSIGYAAGPLERTTTRHRLEGHHEAMRAAGCTGTGTAAVLLPQPGTGAPVPRSASPCTAPTTAAPATTPRSNSCAANRGSRPSSPRTTRWPWAPPRRSATAVCASPRTSRWPASTICRSRWTWSRR